MITYYSSRINNLGEQFLNAKLKGAVSYDRIAGYFCSSILEVVGETIEAIAGKVRVVCNSSLAPSDVAVAKLGQRVEWNEFKPEEVYATPCAMARLRKLYELLKSGKLEVRVLPDEVYGLMHGKAGVIIYPGGGKTSFLGSINETKSAFTTNYEIPWEDGDPASIVWVQAEFDFFWNNSYAVVSSWDCGRIRNISSLALSMSISCAAARDCCSPIRLAWARRYSWPCPRS
ncbi:MAG: phospholipase D-like domain-containing protein [Desulfovibrio sp.]|jgi:hypothetical protein|nr:phospholipase D-like domain-containing protein [Desulfovibrio sp.]